MAGWPAKTNGKNKKGAAAEKAPQNGTLAFAPTLWAAADKLRGNMDAAEYKHVALGLIFLKYISDRFDERRAGLQPIATDSGEGVKTDYKGSLSATSDTAEYAGKPH